MKTKILGALLLCLVMSTISVAGCGISTIDGMTGEQLLDNVLAADSNLHTFKMYSTSEMEMMGMSITVDGYGAYDRNAQEMYMIMEDTGQIYIVGDWMYMEITGMGWIKMELEEDTWEQEDMTAQQLMVLENYAEVKILGREQISGIDCYKIEVVPDLQSLWDWVMEEEDIGYLGYDIDLDELFEEFTITVWIATDSYFMVQSSIDMTMQFLGRVSETITCYDFNEPVDINLPLAAADAEEWDMEEFEEW